MSRTKVKFICGGVVLLAAIAYLAYAGLKDGSFAYHLLVDDYVVNPKYHSERVRLCGKVAEDSSFAKPSLLKANFNLLGQTKSLPVTFTGAIPDLFKPGCDVVIEGQKDSSGVFQADKLMTKCASKYQSADPTKQPEKSS